MKVTSVLLGEVGDAVERVARLEPHRAGDRFAGRDRQAAIAQASAMQVEPRDAEALADRRSSRFAVASSSAAPSSSASRPREIAVHDGEDRAGFLEHAEVVIGPVPDADLEAHFGEALQAPFHRPVAPQHLGAGRQREGRRTCQISMQHAAVLDLGAIGLEVHADRRAQRFAGPVVEHARYALGTRSCGP